MANLKFSDFTAYATTPVTATSGLVAYEGTTNIQFTPAQLAPFTGIYAADGTIGTTRKALVTDTIQFRNAGDTLDVFSLNTNGSFGLGYDGGQITNSITGNESVRISDRSGAPLLKVGVTSGSSGKINICNGFFNTFDYSTVSGMVFTNAGGVNVSQDAASMFTLISTTKGMLTPRMTTTERDAINSGTFTTGLTLYNTTDNKLQFYNGTAWTNTGNDIYQSNGTIGTTRKALITDTIQFRNAGDTSDIFTLNTNGTFALGKGATAAGGYSAVSIGGTANAASNYSVSIGNLSDATSTYAIAIGGGATGAQASGQDGIAIGGNGANASGNSSISIGYSAVTSGDYSINIGRKSRGTGNNAITFNASTDAIAAPSTANAFGVYMTSNTSADFEVVGSGTSTLRTNLNVTGNMEVDGQAWGDLYDPGTPIADGATFTPDWNNGNVQKIVIATGAAITVANGNNVNNGATYLLIIEQAGTGGTVTWGGKYKFPAATAPTLTSGAGKADVITMVAYNSASVLCSSTLDFLTT